MTLKIISFQDDSSGNYEALRIEEDRKVDNRFIATMIIDRLEEDDFEDENHILRSRSFSFLLTFQCTTAQRNFLSSSIYFNQ
jgi:hypothetical protein